MYTMTKFKTCRRCQIYKDLLCLAVGSISYLYGRYHTDKIVMQIIEH